VSSPGLAFSDTKNLGNVTPAVPVPVQSLNFTINPLVKVSALPDQVVELHRIDSCRQPRFCVHESHTKYAVTVRPGHNGSVGDRLRPLFHRDSATPDDPEGVSD
jgi:hypothetical protein